MSHKRSKEVRCINHYDPNLTLEANAKYEILRQAMETFNCQILSIKVSVLIILVGCALPFIGNPTEGILMAVAGSGTSAFCNQLAKDSRSKLEQLIKEGEAS